MVAYEMAIHAGINMAESQVRKFTSDQHTFMTKRFDRTPKGERIHFASAMTLLGYTDGTDHHQGASYLELAEFLTTNGSNVNQDLEELWRRIVFSICISNTDDHLRNHGFLLNERGWKLSPAYDINPVETGTGLTLNISDDDNALDLDLALEVSEFFRLKKERAIEIVDEVKAVVSEWRMVADNHGLSRNEQELKASAFTM
jgi:serine/threonine-protein kinase HipA